MNCRLGESNQILKEEKNDGNEDCTCGQPQLR